MLLGGSISLWHNCIPMKKLIFLLALLIFPLQATWSAVDAYCQQEMYTNSQLCIACTAQVHRESGNEDSENRLSSVKATFDCNNCNASVPVLLTATKVPSFSPSCPPQASEQRHESAVFVERPERPQWRAIFL